MRAELTQRAFPDIDEQLHCVAVKVVDQLKKLYKHTELTSAEVVMMKELTNLLLLVKKQLPSARKKKDSTPTDTSGLFE